MNDMRFNLDDHDRRSAAELIFRLTRTEGTDGVTIPEFFKAIEAVGIDANDRRIRETRENAALLATDVRMSPDQLLDFVAPENTTLIVRALTGELVVPEFFDFRNRMENIFEYCRDFKGGDVATYIPQLARVDPEMYAMAVCTIDGQQFSFGDDEEQYCVQSTCKPISYSIALDCLGARTVHSHVGREPSGRSFNELTLNDAGLPHNPMINSGAIMCSALIRPHHPQADRFDYVMSVWRSLSGGRRPGFDNSVFLSERETADRNFALAYFMRENGAFPPDTDIMRTLDFYFQCCSITVDVRQMAAIAATFANGGVCPMTNQRVFQSETVKNCLSLMYSCGMYDFSGEYAFTVGIPAKSGVSGAMFLVVPGVCGIALWSPRLDRLGNPVRGVEFSKRLVDVFAFHTYANMVDDHRRIDPTKRMMRREADDAGHMCGAAARGDLGEVRRLVAAGIDPSASDYDGRSAMHLAASEGQEPVVRFLFEQGANASARDRWGNTPLDDARRESRDAIVAFLEAALGDVPADQPALDSQGGGLGGGLDGGFGGGSSAANGPDVISSGPTSSSGPNGAAPSSLGPSQSSAPGDDILPN